MLLSRSIVLAMILLASVATSLTRAQSAPAPAAASATVDLSPHFYVGMTSRYEIWSTRTTLRSTSVNDRTQEANTQLELVGELTWRIDSVSADGGATATMTYDWLSATFVMPDGQRHIIDTRQPSPGEPFGGMHQLMLAMSRTPLTFRMNADGSVQSVEGVDQIKAAVAENVQTPEALDFIESATDLATLIEAPTALTVGGAWDVQRTWRRNVAQMEADLHTDTTYTLSSVEEIAGIPVATVTASTRATLDPQLPELPAEVPRPRVNTSATGEQQVMFDLARQEVVGRNASETLTVDVQMSARGMTVNTSVHEIMQSQLLRIAEPQ